MAEHVQGRVRESGVLGHWTAALTDVKRWRAARAMPPGHAVLSLRHMQPIFYLLVLGYAAALATLLGELCCARGGKRFKCWCMKF